MSEAGNSLDRLTQRIEEDPTDIELYEERGNAYMRASRYSDALADFDAAISLDAEDSDVHVDRGRALLEMRREAEAVLAFDEAIRLDPFDGRAYAYRAVEAYRGRRYRDAAGFIDQAISLNSTDALYYHARARIYGALEEPVESLDAISRAIALKPTDGKLCAYRFNLYIYDLVSRDERTVLTDAARAILLAGVNSEVYFGRGLIHFAEERWEQAAQDFTKERSSTIRWNHDRSLVFQMLSRPYLGDKFSTELEVGARLDSIVGPIERLGVDEWPLQAIAMISGKISPSRILDGLLADSKSDERAAREALFELYLFNLILARINQQDLGDALDHLHAYKEYCRIKYYFVIVEKLTGVMLKRDIWKGFKGSGANS